MKFEIKEIEDYMGGDEKKGMLTCFLRKSDLTEKDITSEFQQIYCSTIPIGATRGNHVHKIKKEFFMVTSGKVKLMLEDIGTKERKEIIIDSKERPLKRVWIGTGTAHNLTNISDEVVNVVEYVSLAFDPKNPDRYEYIIE